MKNTIIKNIPYKNLCHYIAPAFSAVVIIASAFHFWPLQNQNAWKTLNPSNLLPALWFALLTITAISKKNRRHLFSILPHTSIFAYIIINFLSISFALDFTRSAAFTIKLTIMLIAAQSLFIAAMTNGNSILKIYHWITYAATISVTASLLTKSIQCPAVFGFHISQFKYATYITPLVCASAAYILSRKNKISSLLAILLITAAYSSAGSVGHLFALSAGLLTIFSLTKDTSAKIYIITAVILSSALLVTTRSTSSKSLYSDIRLAENDNKNLKQRYIESQAEINILEDRTITGTAAGAINDYRSKYYYKLPKLNTLQPFDQNGLLAVAAETGIVGLTCFLWILLHHAGLAMSLLKKVPSGSSSQFAVANLAALTSVAIANLFSSVQYNGSLITFVLVLALIQTANRIYGVQK